MSLFQNSVVRHYLKSLDNDKITIAYQKYTAHFLNPTIQENIRNSKEEQYQEGFLRDLFVNILGYKLNPENDYNLTTELKNIKDSKKVDGAIIINNKVTGVIELKGTNTTDLSKIEEQAFGYKNNQNNDCIYVITSNFEKIRFYIENAINHIEFNLFTLDENQFKTLYLCLSYESISRNLPKKLKDESLSKENDITKKLYKDYSQFKRELFQNLTQLNPEFEPLELFKKSQKLIDRFLFLFFAEDRHLLPPNSVRNILIKWDKLNELDAYTPLIDRFRQFFGYLNTGKDDIFAYNGGLFKPDEILDVIKIDDALLYNYTKKLADYNFESEVDVNILGHIFENSLNEIDEIKAQLEGTATEKSQTKRKKDGVFYTPRYITKYIVENTVGKLCEEKKQEFQILDENYTTENRIQKKTKEVLLTKLKDYRAWLLQITIVDPACGSGAFLNEALNFLIDEHRYIDELEAKLFGDALVLTDMENTILENNLFGVDINEESVEIAKLSLWLRTAQPNRKLNDLSHNIKCGNSLIDDPEIAGDKVFNWASEFPQIFERGGFDVVIGNPPYVFARDNFKQEEKDFFVKEYVSAKYQINTYLLFIEKTVHILKENGIYGLIIPNSWLMMYSGEGLRKFLLETNKLNQIINLVGYSFESANVETVILLAEKESIKNENSIQIFLNNGNEFYFSHSKQQTEFTLNQGFEFKVFLDDDTDELNLKLLNNSEELDSLVEIKAGLQAYEKDKGEPKQTAEDVRNRPYDYNYQFDQDTFKYLDGKDVGRYYVNWSGLYLRYGKHLAAPRTFNLFDGKKIIVREITGKFPQCIISTYSEDIYLYNRSNIAIVEKLNSQISLKYVLSLINSSLMSYYFLKNTAKSVRKLFPKIILNDLRKFPIKDISLEAQQPFIEKADQMLTLNKQLQEASQKFQRSIQREFELETLGKKLENWYELSYADFLKELKKKKVELNLVQKAEWEDYFLAQQQNALSIHTQITQTDKAIDQMVYELYGLTPEEIEIVEKN